MITPPIHILAILPSVVLAIFGIVIMVSEPFLKRNQRWIAGWLALAGVFAGGLSLFVLRQQYGPAYSDLWIVDSFTVFFHFVFLLIAGMTILASMDFITRENLPQGEYYALLLFAVAGMMMMCGSNDLMMIFLGLEILSISTYVLAGFRRHDLKSNESALKYFLLGSFASAFFLYGTALIFGATGTTSLTGIAAALNGPDIQITLAYLAAALILIALSFKVAVAPFHIWTPDVYEGAPSPVTGFMSVGPKAAGFAVLFRIFLTAFPLLQDRWIDVFAVIAALTMVIGNIVALAQPNIKRMLAYSSIAHAGYVAVAFASASDHGLSAGLFYLLAYSVMSLGAFTVITILSRSEDRLVQLSDFAGLGAKRPVLAALLTLFLLSSAGVPGTAGFAGKFFIFRSALESGLQWLTVIGVVSTVISFYYYLSVVVQMYMHPSTEEFADLRSARSWNMALLIAAAGTIYLGILPSRVLEWAASAASALIR
jgi:NADH-quinone oxidoreductase subunit N